MGQSSSSSILPSADPRVPYFSLTFQSPDKLTLALADDSIVAFTRSAISESISYQSAPSDFLQYEGRNEMNAYVFKFRGLPFRQGRGSDLSFHVSRICCKILENYWNNGWLLILATDISRAKELTTWFFAHSIDSDGQKIDNSIASCSSTETRKKNILCVSFNSSGVIRLANATEASRRALTQAIRTGFAINGIKSELIIDSGDFEIQLTESPWLSEDAATCVRARRLTLEIMRRFEVIGYQFYGTANTKGTSDSLFFISSQCGHKSSPPSCPKSPKLPKTIDEGSETCYHDVCAISLHYSNCLRVVDAPTYVAKSVLRAIVRYWPQKLQHQTALDESAYEFKLRGHPWWETGGDEAIAARHFLCGLLETMKSIGWEPLAALDVTRRLNDKAVFIFRSSNPVARKKSRQGSVKQPALVVDDPLAAEPYWCLSMHEHLCMRFIGAPATLRHPLRHTIDQIWPWGVQNESSDDANDSFEFTLRGGPWGAEQQNTTALMCYILKSVSDQGFRVILSADITGRRVPNDYGGSHCLDFHSWFFKLAATPKSSDSNFLTVKDVTSSRLAQKRKSMTRSVTGADEFVLPVPVALKIDNVGDKTDSDK